MEQPYNPNPSFGTPYAEGPPPKNWLVESILVTIFCCLPFGIVGIINAASVSTKFAQGDLAGAQQASAAAAKWTKIGFFSGLAVGAIYMIMMFLGVGGALMSGIANQR